jgi:hypothetical protein
MQKFLLEEEANMLTCNLLKTIQNTWLQQYGKRGACLYVTIFDDYIRVLGNLHCTILSYMVVV